MLEQSIDQNIIRTENRKKEFYQRYEKAKEACNLDFGLSYACFMDKNTDEYTPKLNATVFKPVVPKNKKDLFDSVDLLEIDSNPVLIAPHPINSIRTDEEKVSIMVQNKRDDASPVYGI